MHFFSVFIAMDLLFCSVYIYFIYGYGLTVCYKEVFNHFLCDFVIQSFINEHNKNK